MKQKLKGVLGLFLILLMGCETVDNSKMEEVNKTVGLADVESAKISLDMQAGKLELRGENSVYLMQSRFQTTNKKWIPIVNHKISGKEAELFITHPKNKNHFMGNEKIRWDVRLNNKVLTDLHVESGVGYFYLDLSNINLKSLTMSAGIGEMKVDLTGNYDRDLRVKVEGGIGEATFLIPEALGVKAVIDGGLGTIVAKSLIKNGRIYTNESYGKTGHSIFISVRAGLGTINLVTK